MSLHIEWETPLTTAYADDFLPEALQFRPSTPLVDIGANLTHESFGRDLEAVIQRAQAAQVTTMIVTGTDLAHAEQAVELAKQSILACTPRRVYTLMTPAIGTQVWSGPWRPCMPYRK